MSLTDYSSQMPNPPPVVKGITHLSPVERMKLWHAAQDLEATFSTYLLKDVRFGGTEASGKQSFAADTFGDMFKQTLANQMARSNSMGLARDIYIDSARLAEKAKAPSTIHPGAANGHVPQPAPEPQSALPPPMPTPLLRPFQP